MDYEKDMKKLENIDMLRTMIDKSKTGMLTTFTATNGFHSRPMGTAQLDVDGSLWFFTNEFSPKVAEISQDNKVNVTYTNSGASTYISINGIASVVDNRVKMQELWDPYIQAFFPNGLEDPTLTLLKVDVSDVEYWDNSAGPLAVAFKWIQAKITGKKYEEGEHNKMSL
ncbi:pyridoxamine 5'-phosphate oxidase family protein [Mucilaginibacter robiniae]|uniref:Pyridoxamine 5'-phosphate oxidase family protein n=1 Tax=Mucilaginibacter robiniae TaxID=2728022 RepID=A0A7L5E3Y9_9SPHI|nr:pyridoxamine 5'-phosphate oxidase family protein [Mucilaginibacter robiniae]QJD98042.1 pyridoxamine 5'-phosphate oxidase family protein [Mucilaginibacter robiniae]